MMLNLIDKPIHALEEFVKIAISLSSERNLKLLLTQILSASRQLTYAESGQIYILDYSKRYLVPEVYQNELLVDILHPLKRIPLYLKNNNSNLKNICAYSAFIGNLINIPDIYSYSGFDFKDSYYHDLVNHYKTQSCITIPLRSHANLTIGILQLQNCRNANKDKLNKFPESLHSLVSAFASQAAVALDNTLLIQKNQTLIERLNETNKTLIKENENLKQKIALQSQFNKTIIGDSLAMKQVFKLLEKILNTDVTIFIKGETGTGKELIAQAIHYNSHRKNSAFIAQNCSTLPENLLESELFGYKRGAFSGADKDKEGLIKAADGGTLFLDEIGDMPLNLQAKLLRIVQDKLLRPLGSNESSLVNVRIIAATHKNLEQMIKAGDFREDLYYRLNVYPIELPPLRSRKEDIPSLLTYYLDKYSKKYNKEIQGLSPIVLDLLLAYDYFGNIRELSNIIERAVLLAENKGYILPEHLDNKLTAPDFSIKIEPNKKNRLKSLVANYEATLIQQELKEHQGNQTNTAKKLGISRRCLIEKINRYQIVS